MGHYWSHLGPLWDRLPDRIRGRLYAPRVVLADGEPLRGLRDVPGSDLVLVASGVDLARVRGRAVMCEHGAGQSYQGDQRARRHSGYAGGDGRGKVALFLHPNEQAAARDRARYPSATVEVVGMLSLSALRRVERDPPGPKPTVALSCHWNAPICRESQSGWAHWRTAFGELARSGEFEVLGHAHPRVWGAMRPTWERMGVEPVRDFAEVVRRAQVYAVDNSSTLYEAAGCGLGVVVLDCPNYRQDVNHGLRFWDAADVGPRICASDLLPHAIRAALHPRTEAQSRALEVAVPPLIDDPAQTAADTVVRFVDGL